MLARRDAKQVPSVASGCMTEAEYEAAVAAEHMFGRIQVHQQFRKLATTLGLPPDCSMPAVVRDRLPRWYVDPEALREERWQAYDRAMSAQLRYLFSEPSFINVA